GEKPKGFAISRTNEGEGLIKVQTPQDLVNELTKLKNGTDAKLPIIVMVHTLTPMFTGNANQGGAGGAVGGWHVGGITDYDPRTMTVAIDNQWGTKLDMLGKPGDKGRVKLGLLFQAMQAPAPVAAPAPAPRR